MRICKFQLHIDPREPIILPPYKGSTLRGGFGNAFKKVVCALKERECSGCILREQCVYSYVFETPPPADAKVMRKYPAVPHPFVIEPPPGNRVGYTPGREIAFGLVLVGKAIDYLPYFVYAFNELGDIGLGKGRGKYRLKSVSQIRTAPPPEAHCSAAPPAQGETLIYSSETGKLSPFSPEDLMVDIGPHADHPLQSSSLTLKILTPTRIILNDGLTNDFQFHVLIRQLLRRISMLSYFHCGIDPSGWDFKSLIDRAAGVTVKHKNLRWYCWQRYSARQERKIDMDGFVGDITYEGDLAPFLSLIRAGEILHVGKGTTFGLGRYTVVRDL